MRLFDENRDVDAHLGDEARDGAPHGAHLERDQVVDHLRGEGRLGTVTETDGNGINTFLCYLNRVKV